MVMDFAPDGQITDFLSSPLRKNISAFLPTQITSLIPAVPSHPKGRLAIVTDAGRDAVDARGADNERR
jgi:hypothetical protein